MSNTRSGIALAAGLARVACCVLVSLGSLLAVPPVGRAAGAPGLVVSELTTGGASSSDEFIEIYNAGQVPASLADIELVYVTASGSTITRRAAWTGGSLPPYAHLLVANEAGIYRTIADATYSGGLSATGGSVALRIVGGNEAVDTVAWGNASSIWVEGSPATAPAAGASLERLPGGELGSATDTDDNARDFVVREAPEPQNTGSEPTPPGDGTPTDAPTPVPTATSVLTPRPTASGSIPTTPAPTRTPTPMPSGTPTRTPSSAPSHTPAPSATNPPDSATPIADARAMPDGSRLTIEGTALTASDFTDGGGYVWDATAGIAVLLREGSFRRGDVVRVTGTLDERYHQRTLRADGASVEGTGSEPTATSVSTGSVSESREASLVRISGELIGSGSDLTAGRAFEVDDGSGPIRVFVPSSTGIDTSRWTDGAQLDLTGVVGQRDSGGTGTAGYRVMPPDDRDIHRVTAAPTPSARPTGTPRATPPQTEPGGSTPTATQPGSEPVISIAEARAAQPDTRVRISGVVTSERGLLLDEQSAVIQDETGAVLLRVPDNLTLGGRGETVDVTGERSTKSGMVTVRVEAATIVDGGGELPATSVTTASASSAGEDLESELLQVRGVLGSVRRSSAGNLSFTVDDGSGPLRVFVFSSTTTDTGSLTTGSWVELRGVLGQDTSGDRPNEGYRLWPRGDGDVRLVAPATDESGDESASASPAGDDDGPTGGSSGSSDGTPVPQDLAALIEAGSAGTTAPPSRATLVTGPWAELDLAGVLWDGSRAVVIPVTEAAADAVEGALSGRRPPAVVDVAGATATGHVGELAAWAIAIDRGTFEPAAGRPASPLTEIPAGDGPAVWARVTGVIGERDGTETVQLADTTVLVTLKCEGGEAGELWRSLAGEHAVLEGLLGRVHGQPELLVPCGGLDAAPAFTASRSGVEPRSGTKARPAQARASEIAAAPPLLPAAGAVTAMLVALVGTLAWRTGTFGRLLARGPASRDGVEAETELAARRDDASLPMVLRVPPP